MALFPVRACSTAARPTYKIKTRLMPACDDLADVPDPAPKPLQLRLPMSVPQVARFGCFLPSVTGSLSASATAEDTALVAVVSAENDDSCRYNLQLRLSLPATSINPPSFVLNPPSFILNPPDVLTCSSASGLSCGSFAVSTETVISNQPKGVIIQEIVKDSTKKGVCSTKINEGEGSTQDIVLCDGDEFNAVADGYTSDAYTLTVLSDGNASSVSVVSTQGDNVGSVYVSGNGNEVVIGTKGLKVTFKENATFKVGDVWRVTVSQDYTKPSAAADGVFTGNTATADPDTIKYRVRAISSGSFSGGAAPVAQLSVQVLEGNDTASGTITPTSNAAFNVGTKGITLKLAGTYLLKDSEWIISASTVGSGIEVTSDAANACNKAVKLKTQLPDVFDFNTKRSRLRVVGTSGVGFGISKDGVLYIDPAAATEALREIKFVPTETTACIDGVEKTIKVLAYVPP